jgi:uncharacterized phosphosugar-binding protein
MNGNANNDHLTQYLTRITGYLHSIWQNQKKTIRRGAELMADQIAADRLIYVFGVGGHSYVGSEEFFYRAGGLANISPMFDLSLSLAGGGQKSTMLERLEGYGDKVVAAHHLAAGDLLVITSVYGMNACTIDAALEAKRRGCRLLAVTSVEAAKNTPPGFVARHSSAKSLHEIADVTVDTHVPYGEVCVDIPGVDQLMGGTCNILQCFCINALVMEAAAICAERGVDAPVWSSANVAGGDEGNRNLLERFTPRVKYL